MEESKIKMCCSTRKTLYMYVSSADSESRKDCPQNVVVFDPVPPTCHMLEKNGIISVNERVKFLNVVVAVVGRIII
jgi:hypothetical protein